MQIECAHCGRTAEKPTGHVNRSRANGLRLYCNRRCAGLARRKPRRSKAQRIAEKAAYDREYRRKNRERIKANKAAYFQTTYDPEKARVERKKRMAQHVEYCRRPAYKVWKSAYDRQRRAAEYGPAADAYLLTLELNREIKKRSSNYEIRQANRTGNKAQQRARDAKEEDRDRRRGHSAAHG